MKHPERVYSRASLLDKLWGDHVDIEERTRRDDQQRPQPLTAANAGMAHGVEQRRALVIRNRQQRVEQPVDIARNVRQRIAQYRCNTPIAFLTPVKRRGASGRAVAAQTDFFDPRQRILQTTFALRPQRIAFGIECD